MCPREGERRWGGMVALVVALLVFLIDRVAARGDTLYAGHDHWCTGHLMLLAEAYLKSGFATPALMPTEDAFGPIGTWAPYSGWPPLFALALAGFLEAFGTSLSTARTFACLWSGASAGLVYAALRRVTRDPVSTRIGLAMFVGHSVVTRYSGFVCNDVAALAAGMALLLAFPAAVGARRVWPAVGLALATVPACLLSWQCFIAPVAAAMALAVARPSLVRRRWARAAAPSVVAVLTGAVLLSVMGRVDAAYEPNGWIHLQPRAAGGGWLASKLLERTGLSAPGQAVELLAWALKNIAQQLYVPGAIALATFGVCRRTLEAAPRDRAAGPRDRRYVILALWLFPLGWFVSMPQMLVHDFQLIFTAPALCVSLALLLSVARPTVPGMSGGWLYAIWAAALVGLPAIAQFGFERVNFRDSDDYARLTREIQAASAPGTLVVFGEDDRGLWWRIRRPAITLKRLGRALGRDHIVVGAESGIKGWEAHYELFRRVRLGPRELLIVRPRAPTREITVSGTES